LTPKGHGRTLLFWRAWNAIDALDAGFEVNLVDWEDATPALLENVAR
jgi:hypothetical protein